MDKRSELEKDLAKASGARDRITAQLEETESRIKQLQAAVNNELMENKSSSSLQELSLAREKVTSLQQAIQFGNSQVNQARQALEDHDRAARGGEIIELDKKVQQAVVSLQAKIGETGLKSQIDELGKLIAELERLSNGSVRVHGAEEHLTVARNVHDRLNRALLVTWQDIEQLRWAPAHPTADGHRPDYVPGFGVKPGSL